MRVSRYEAGPLHTQYWGEGTDIGNRFKEDYAASMRQGPVTTQAENGSQRDRFAGLALSSASVEADSPSEWSTQSRL